MLQQFIQSISAKLEFGTAARLRFYSKLSQLLDNGVGLDKALGQIQATAAQKKGSYFAVLLTRWRKNTANGVNFGQCLAPYIPASEAMLIETGSNSGKLAQALRNASTALEGQAKVRGAILGSMAYPFVLFIMLIAALMLASFKVIPTFEQIIPVETWTGVPYVVAVAAKFIREYTFLIFGALILVVIAIFASFPRWTGKSRVKADAHIPWSLYRTWQGSAFLLSVSSMLSSGIKVDELSLGRIGRNADPYMRQRLRAVTRRVMQGDNLGEALLNAGYKFPDEEIIRDLQIYAKLRGFDKNLTRITHTWLDSLAITVQNNMKIVNFVMLVLIALVIGVLITAFYDIFTQIQAQSQPKY